MSTTVPTVEPDAHPHPGDKLLGRVAFVTGGTRGIGAAICRSLASQGATVAAGFSSDTGCAEAFKADLERDAGKVSVHRGNIGSAEDCRRTVTEVMTEHGRLDILVNNAGATKRGDFLKLTEEDWQDGYALKFHGYVRMTRAAWPHLRDSRGSIVNIAGIGARAGAAEFTIGGSVNAAILYFTKAMADQGVTDGVRVNAINPGHIATDRLLRNFDRMAADQGVTRDQAADQLLAACRTERFGRPQEIGAVTAFLASAQASFVQGALIDVDGGETRSL